MEEARGAFVGGAKRKQITGATSGFLCPSQTTWLAANYLQASSLPTTAVVRFMFPIVKHNEEL